MNDNETKRAADEALADEALDAVTGGGRKDSGRPLVTCPKCNQPKERLVICRDPKDPTKHESMCPDCARDLGYV